MSNNLEELRDIHLPIGVSAFPPAIGWYGVLLFLIAIVVLFFVIKKAIKYSRSRYVKKALEKTSTDEPVVFAKVASNLLRRICVYKFKQASVYKGLDWQEFLSTHCSYKLDSKSFELLINAPYLNKKTTEYSSQNAQEIKAFVKKFAGENL